MQQQLRVLLEDELDRTTVVRLLKSVAYYHGTISEALQQALAEHIQVACVTCSITRTAARIVSHLDAFVYH